MGRDSRFFTLVVIPGSGGKVRRIVIPKFLVPVSIIGLIVASFALFYFINEYKIMKEKLVYFENLEKLTRMQQERIVSLVEKVREFDETINRLEEMESRLRRLAGIGGSELGISEGLGKGGPEEYIPFEDSLSEKGKVDSLSIIERIENNVDFLKIKALRQEKAFDQVGEIIEKKKKLFSSTPNIFPVQGWISAGYGMRINPFTRKREMHKAIDIVAPWGTAVKAACRGKVTFAGWKNFYGLVIEIKNEYGYSTVYGHLSYILVKKGQRVEKGEIIGRVGSSGRSTGPHLHFEVWYRGKTLNPLKLMVEPLGLS